MYRKIAVRLAWVAAAGVTLPGCGSLQGFGLGKISSYAPDLVCKASETGGGIHIVDRVTGDIHASLDEAGVAVNGVISGRGAVVDFDGREESELDRFTADFNQGRCYAGIKHWIPEVSAPMAPELLRSRTPPNP